MKGFVLLEIFVVLTILFLVTAILITCHQNVSRKQKIMAQIGIEMSYWDIFFIAPALRINQGQITIRESDIGVL